jgi:hypothetical protein
MDPLMEHNAGTNDRCPMFEVHHLERAYPSSRSFQNIACPLNVVELNHIVVSESFWRLIFFEQTGNPAKESGKIHSTGKTNNFSSKEIWSTL